LRFVVLRSVTWPGYGLTTNAVAPAVGISIAVGYE
jgi:hypothetical protein